MIQLYQWPSDGQLPNAGFFCMKLESYLRLQKIPHQVRVVRDFGKSPKQTMPYIEQNGVFKSDSQIIIDELEKIGPQSLQASLTEGQKAESQAFQMMLENHLIPIVTYFRWVPDQGWNQFSKLMFYGAPAPIRILIGGLVRRKTLKRMKASGLSRHSADELTEFADRDLAALAQLLGDKKFFFNDRPSLLDLVTFTVICNIMMGRVEMPLIDLVKKHKNLMDHSQRMMELVFQRTPKFY